jgi:hypothetical protein
MIKVIKTPRLGSPTIFVEKTDNISLKSLKFDFKTESSIFKILIPLKLIQVKKMCLPIEASKYLQQAEVVQIQLIKKSCPLTIKIKSLQERKSSFSRKKFLMME